MNTNGYNKTVTSTPAKTSLLPSTLDLPVARASSPLPPRSAIVSQTPHPPPSLLHLLLASVPVLSLARCLPPPPIHLSVSVPCPFRLRAPPLLPQPLPLRLLSPPWTLTASRWYAPGRSAIVLLTRETSPPLPCAKTQPLLHSLHVHLAPLLPSPSLLCVSPALLVCRPASLPSGFRCRRLSRPVTRRWPSWRACSRTCI